MSTSTPAEVAEPDTGPQDAPQAPPSDEQTPEVESDERDDTGRYLSREAANYRRRLRDAETERDGLRERLERYERAEVERLAAGAGLAVPGDVWSFGASLETLRAEDGSVDAETVNGVVADIIKNRPGLEAVPAGDVGIGRGAGARPRNSTPTPGLSQLLKPGQR